MSFALKAVHRADGMKHSSIRVSQMLRWGSAWLTCSLPQFGCNKGLDRSSEDREKRMGSERKSHRDDVEGELGNNTDAQTGEGANP